MMAAEFSPPLSMAPVLPRITDYVHHHAARFPDREAVVADDRRWTYADLERNVERWARSLIASGIAPGDRVAMLGIPSPEFLAVFLATTGIGAIWLGLSPRYQLEEYRYLLGDASPRVLIALTEFEGRDYAADLAALREEFPCIRSLVTLDRVLPDSIPYADFLQCGEVTAAERYHQIRHGVEAGSAALIVYTSGSSGKPKGAMLSHHGLCLGNAIQGREFGVDVPRAVCPFPINHVACVGDTCCTTLIRGGTLVFMPRFDADAVLDTIQHERINLWIGVPTMFILASERPGFVASRLASLETIVWGGAAMPRAQIQRFQGLNARLMTLYGLTESTTDISFTAADADLEQLADTVGRPPPEFEVRVVDTDGKPQGVAEPGELQIRSDVNMLGYYQRPDATQAAFTADGWLRTGDLGYRRDDGNLVLVGRLSEMFKSGGFNVYPREIEEAIESHPAVALAAVFGVPDPLFQEVGEAWVLLTSGGGVDAVALASHCREQLANYKVPKRFFLCSELPMLPVGKIDKARLKRDALTRLADCNDAGSDAADG